MPRADVILTLCCNELDDSRLDAMTRAMTRSLQEEGLNAAAARGADAVPGTKGDVVTIGTIALSLIGSGGVAVTLLQVLKAYLERKSTLCFEIIHPDGRKISFDASFFAKAQLEQTRKILTDLLEK
jgi:alkylated DNA nucleotide flippase Atl1